jgi:hypothetical protein
LSLSTRPPLVAARLFDLVPFVLPMLLVGAVADECSTECGAGGGE